VAKTLKPGVGAWSHRPDPPDAAGRVEGGSEERARALLDAMPAVVLRVRRDGAILDYKADRDFDFALPPHAFLGKTLREVVPHMADAAMLCIERALETGRVQIQEYQTMVGGRLRDREARVVASGPDEVLAVVRDLTEQREAHRMKEQFVSMISHELRTPLTAIHGALALLTEGVLGPIPDRAREMLGVATANTERLIRLTNDIIDVQRLRLGQFEIVKTACNAADLAAQAVDAMRVLAARVQITLECAPQAVPLIADGDRIVQVLLNLLSNAIRHSPPGSTVNVTASQRGDRVVFQVKDRGTGIPVYNLETIFEAFKQADAPDMRARGGMGLGLYICRKIVEAHGGRIWAESAPGQGATFTFTLPLADAYRDAEGPRPAA
jgi:signal transduction histidine kinase